MLQTADSRLCLPLPVVWEVMWHWNVQGLNLYLLSQKRHLGWSLSQPSECFLTRSGAEIVLRSSSWSVSCSGTVVWNFCMSSSCKPLSCIISAGSRRVLSDKIFGYKFWRRLYAWHTLFSRGLRGWRCTKFEVNQTNLKRVILPSSSSVSSDDLRPDISWRQADVRPDVTTKRMD
jgi:hypothetical protein